MPRSIDVDRLVQVAGDAKLINLDTTLKDVVSSGIVNILNNGDDPWITICGDWVMLFHRGPHFPLEDFGPLTHSLQKSLDLANALQTSLTARSK